MPRRQKHPKDDAPRLPFAELKVADFSWVGVGPITTRYLADYGATVVRVESATRPDTLRRSYPFKDNIPGLDRSGFYAMFNAGKYGMTLNLNAPRGPEVAKRLIQWADVVAESFTPGTMERWGLDYESVYSLKPDMVYFSTSQMGQTGPWASLAGFGTQLVSLAGFTHLIGWPDRPPAGTYGAYTDFISHHFAGAVLLAALEHRRRTGQGQHIDLSQLEASLQFLAPWLVDYFATGRVPARQGNLDADAVPHNVYPCKGKDRWVAIAVVTEEQWRGLVSAMADPAWTADPKFATPRSRREHQEELDRLIAEWTALHTAEQAMAILQSAGVPAGVVQSNKDLFSDPQLQHRGHFVKLEHREVGTHAYDQFGFRLSRTPGRPQRAAPTLGQHNDYVYRELLGYTDDEIGALVESGVME
jgi:benzylsuccinate CoA-transferase BbsF subunit